jgi:hypothetical protein
MIGFAQRIVRALSGALGRQPSRSRPSRVPSAPPHRGRKDQRLRRPYPGDFTGYTTITYSPRRDDKPDPGEIVWTWVPYEDDPKEGKDRPVLLIGWDDGWMLGLMLTSKDHNRDAADEARFGRHWMDIGVGDWDSLHRPSEVRLDRILRVGPTSVRREGAELDAARFGAVARAVKEIKGW